MSDNTIEQPDSAETPEAGEAPPPDAAADQPQPCVTCGQLPDGGNSESAMRRRQLRASEVMNEVLNAKNDALERQIVEAHVTGRIASSAMPDFIAKTDIATLRNDEGGIDYGRLDEHVAGVLVDNPHLAAADPTMPVVASAPTSGSAGGIGFPPTSALNPTEATGQPSWDDVIKAGAKGGG